MCAQRLGTALFGALCRDDGRETRSTTTDPTPWLVDVDMHNNDRMMLAIVFFLQALTLVVIIYFVVLK